MELRLTHKNDGGELCIDKTQYAHGHRLLMKIQKFIDSHKHHVLRDHHQECKISNIALFGDKLREDGRVLLFKFFTSYDNYKPYLEILQKEFDLKIQEQ